MTEMWDSVAGSWERNAEFVDHHLSAATRELLDAARVSEGGSVLDLATGPGGTGLAAADRIGVGGRVVLADDAPQMVAVAARRIGSRSNVETMICDQSDIPLPDSTFDSVVIRHGLMFAEDHVVAVREAVRVLNSGGHYAAMTWGPRVDNPWLGLILDSVGEEFGVPFPPAGIAGPFSLEDEVRLATVLVEAGLEDVRVRQFDTPMSAASLDDWWERVPQLAGPVAIALEGMDPEVRESIHRRSLAAGKGAARRSGDGIVMSGSVLIASGRSR